MMTISYVLNREPYEIPVSFTFGGHSHALTVPPFSLRVFEAGGISVPSDIVCDIAPLVKKTNAAEAKKRLPRFWQCPMMHPKRF